MLNLKYLFLSSLLVASAASARESLSLNFGWEFEDSDGSKSIVDVPHDFLISHPWVAPDKDDVGNANDPAANIKSRLSSRGFKEMGKGTYRKNLFIPDSLKGKRIVLDFEGIMLTGEAYLNGEKIGGTDYGYLGFESDVTSKVNYGGDNELVVIADTGEPLNSRWYTGGGLYRDVNMVVTDKDMHFNRHGLYITTPEISDAAATAKLVIDANIGKPNEKADVRIDIIGPDGEVVLSEVHPLKFNPKWRSHEFELDPVTIPNPRLWDCDNPNMYTAEVSLLRADGSVADRISDDFGIRTIEISPEFGLKLNGKKVLLKGNANHHTLGALGAAAYPRAIEKRVKMLKDFGFNHIRTSHNPYSEQFLDICDRNGILVVDEVYDKWLKQYIGGKNEWESQWQHDIPEWIKRDRNHPSVVVWSLGNELQGFSNMAFNDWGVTCYRLQKTLLDRYDDTRPVTVAMHPRYRDLDTDSLPAPLVHETDIAAYNYRYMYFPGDAQKFPDMVFYQSEANLTNMGPNFFEPDNDKVMGLAYWGMIDYLGESLGWPAKGWPNGVFNIMLEPKPNAWFLKSMFVDEPVVHLGVFRNASAQDWNGVKIATEEISHFWNGNPGDSLKVMVYTNGEEVALLINGKEIGRKTNAIDNPKKRNKITFDKVPYKQGKIEAVAYNGGKEVARHKIETAGKPVKLVAEIDNSDFTADGIDLQHVIVYAVDNKGRRSPFANELLSFDVSGPAKLVAVDNGDINSGELHVADTRSLNQGAAMAILRATQEPGTVTLTVSADGYKPIKLNFESK